MDTNVRLTSSRLYRSSINQLIAVNRHVESTQLTNISVVHPAQFSRVIFPMPMFPKMASVEATNRLEAELELLQAMYPEAISFSLKGREVKYVHVPAPDTCTPTSTSTSTLLLRLPDLYPAEGLPEVLSANGPQREDLRSPAKEAIASSGLVAGEEVLDAIILRFQDLLNSRASSLLNEEEEDRARGNLSRQDDDDNGQQFRTVVIWLHHLLNTNKRKLALNPTIAGPGSQINGLTKPGYPGVLVFSGPKSSVDAHVSELRSQRWQAFQVRYDSDNDVEVDSKSCWSFVHGIGIREVESMSELTQGISDTGQRGIFLHAIGVK